MTLLELLTRALVKVQAINARETPDAGMTDDAKMVFNSMMANLFTSSNKVFASVKENTTLSNGTASYTIGTGATISTDWPEKIVGAFIRSSNYDYPVDVISEKEYREISDKTNTGRPEKLFYQPEYPAGKIYLYYTPDSAYDLHIWSQKPLDAITSLTAPLVFPRGYETPIIANLAKTLLSEYPVDALSAQMIIAEARESLDRIESLNASRNVEPAKLDIMTGKRYTLADLNAGE